MVLHANYVESLLQDQWAREVPVWIDVIMDLFVGMIIYMCFEAARKWSWKLSVLLGAFFIPIICAYLFLNLKSGLVGLSASDRAIFSAHTLRDHRKAFHHSRQKAG
jgi:TRAP-type C4-dicarboxylate transport system permease small subunit